MTMGEFRKLTERVPDHAQLLVGQNEIAATSVLVATLDDDGSLKTFVTVQSKWEPKP